jgi:hypothetical protein
MAKRVDDFDVAQDTSAASGRATFLKGWAKEGSGVRLTSFHSW